MVLQAVDVTKLVLQTEEVQAVRWASRDEILAMIDAGIFIPYFKSKIDMCFELVGQYGAIKRS